MPESLRRTDLTLLRTGIHAEEVAWKILCDRTNVQQITALKNKCGLQGDEVERLLLWHASRQALPRVPSLPVYLPVREKLGQDLRDLQARNVSMAAGSYNFDRAARMATLRRFPAGPMEWEISGIPRSYFLHATFPANLRLFAFVVRHLKGLVPCFFIHVAPSPRNRALTVQKEVLRSYYQMARSLEFQPEVRAILGHAWFHDPAAVRDYPHLEPLNRPFVNHGGLITLLKPAPPDSGVLERNPQRSADYLAGKVQYRYGFAIWPRDAAIQWANAHPEFGE